MNFPFSVVFDEEKSATDVNNDLEIIREWVDQWNLLNYTYSVSTHISLFGKSSFNTITNTLVLYTTIDFSLST